MADISRYTAPVSNPELGLNYGGGIQYTPNPSTTPAATRYTTPPPAPAPLSAPTASSVAAPGAPSLAPVDENTIRHQTADRMQSQIDAINANYSDLITQENQTGEDRAGQTRAQNARSGTIGSDFGDAAATKTDQFNKSQVKALENEKAAKVAAVQANIEDRASQAIRDARTDALNKYNVDNTAYQRNQDLARTDLQSLAKAGVSYDPNNTAHQALLKQAGYDPATGELLWNNMKDQAQQVNYQYEPKLGAFIGVDPVTHQMKKIEVPGAGPEADTMLGLIQKYPDAGISLSDTLDSAAAKVKSSAVFRKDTYIAPTTNTGGSTPSTYTAGQNPVVDSWVQNINSGKAKFSDVPKNILNSVAQGLAATGTNSGSDILTTTKQSIDELNALVKDHGFAGAVGAKGLSSFFGLKSKPIGGTAAANFDAKLQQVKNDVILPNLTLLHGLGRVTDREFQALSSAVTSLSTDQSESAFKDELKTLTDRINEKVNSASGNNFSITTPDGQSHTFPDQKSLDAFKQAAGLK